MRYGWSAIFVFWCVVAQADGQQPARPLSELLRDLDSTNAEVRAASVTQIMALGPAAKAELPRILKAVVNGEDRYSHEQVIRVVAAVDRSQLRPHLRRYLATYSRSGRAGFSPEFRTLITPTLIPELTELLRDDSAQVRDNCRDLLVSFGEKSRSAVPQLVECLTLPDFLERWAFVQAVLTIEVSQYRQVLPCLMELLARGQADGDRAGLLLRPVAAHVVADLVAEFGKYPRPTPYQLTRALIYLGKPAVLPLCHALAHEEPRIRLGAATTLGGMSAERDLSIPELITALADPDGAVCLAAAESILSLDYLRSAEVVPTLRTSLRAKEVPLVLKAARLLEVVGSRGQAATADLLPLLKHDDLDVAWQAGEALWAIDSRFGAALLPCLRRVLADGTVPQQRRAVNIAGTLGPLAQPCLPDLIKVCYAGDVSVRLACADALPKVAPDAVEHVARSLTFILQQKHRLFRRYRQQILVRLEKLGPGARCGLPVLAEIVSDEDSNYRTVAARAMVHIAPDENTVGKDFLRAVIWNRNSDQWDDVADALSALGPKAEFAVPELLAVLRERPLEPNPTVVEILGEIGPGASNAVPHLLEALTFPKYPHKDRCTQALKRIAPETAAHLKLK